MSEQYPQVPQPPQQQPPSQQPQYQPPQYQQQPYQQGPAPYQRPVPPPKQHKTRNIVAAGSVGVVILIGLIGGAFSDKGTDPNAGKDSKPAAVASVPPKDDSSAPAPVATTKAPSTPKASAKPTPAKPVPAKTTVAPPKPEPVVYRKLTSRQWAKLVKSPDDHVGETILVYGVVTQFDAATGEDGFRADADSRRHSESYEYPENTVFQQETGSTKLDDVVEGDFFTAKVLVLGSYSYDTQIGGNTTVPSFEVVSVSVTGHED
ncbi:hypothetical protein [Kribbella sp. NPDC051718]|uniref:hypothetical protein n=1 Tax=Kribbella sp. NPDC051718 TaxID=3155168 RepID=UPI003443D728